MKSSTVVGTPVRSIKAGNVEGMMAGTPKGYEGVVNRQYQGDQSGNRQTGVNTGTPYNTRNGNGPESKRVASSDKHGIVIDTQTGVDLNEPTSNGNGVILDGMTRESDYTPRGAAAMDSPVPQGSPTFEAGAMRAENIAHLGKGKGAAASQAGDVLLAIGGVMSRGIAGTTKASDSSTALIEDDLLENLGSGGAI